MAKSDKPEKGQFVFDLKRHIGVLSTSPKGWTKEVNLISWNNGNVKVDIRDWDPDREHMSRGITLHFEEAKELAKLLENEDFK